MAKGNGLNKFSGKYGFFLSEASNEEIVSISKELTDEMSEQIKMVNNTAIALLGFSVISLVLSITLIASSMSATGTYGTMVFLFQVLGIALLALSAFFAYLGIQGMLNASSIPTVIWRNVRETANDDKAYEQMGAVKQLNKLLVAAKSNARFASLSLAFGGLCIGLAYIVQLLATYGYI